MNLASGPGRNLEMKLVTDFSNRELASTYYKEKVLTRFLPPKTLTGKTLTCPYNRKSKFSPQKMITITGNVREHKVYSDAIYFIPTVGL